MIHNKGRGQRDDSDAEWWDVRLCVCLCQEESRENGQSQLSLNRFLSHLEDVVRLTFVDLYSCVCVYL